MPHRSREEAQLLKAVLQDSINLLEQVCLGAILSLIQPILQWHINAKQTVVVHRYSSVRLLSCLIWQFLTRNVDLMVLVKTIAIWRGYIYICHLFWLRGLLCHLFIYISAASFFTATQFSNGASAELSGLQQVLLSALNGIGFGDLTTQGYSSHKTCPRWGVLP